MKKASGESTSTGLRRPCDLIVLLIVAIPAFSGYPLQRIQSQIIAGVSWSWPVYLGVVHLALALLLNRRSYANIVAAAALITLPVVFVGAAVSHLLCAVGISARPPAAHGIHYVRLCLTMLTVVPLAIGLVALVPFNHLEQRLLNQSRGIGLFQKKLLMGLRVFEHIAFFVLPNTLEVLREERPGRRWRESWHGGRLRTVILFLKDSVQLAVEIICSSLQYIPLWAMEIAQLPEPGPRKLKDR